MEEQRVNGWDDPRMPTLVGARRRGYSAQGFRLFAERIGVSKNDSLIDYVLFEEAMREVMNESDQRRVAVLDPLKLIIDNYPEGCRCANRYGYADRHRECDRWQRE